MSFCKSDSIAKLADALAKAQGDMKPAKKDSENPFFKSNYADLAAVWEAIRVPFSKYGLSIAQVPAHVSSDGMVTLSTVLLHASGEWIAGDLTMKAAKNDPQAIGSCLTYARRYALSAITGVATEDDDAEGATGRGKDVVGIVAPVKQAPKPVPSAQATLHEAQTVTGYATGTYTPKPAPPAKGPGTLGIDTQQGEEILFKFWSPNDVAGINEEGHRYCKVTWEWRGEGKYRAKTICKPIEWLDEPTQEPTE
jgi:hypothetical protein